VTGEEGTGWAALTGVEGRGVSTACQKEESGGASTGGEENESRLKGDGRATCAVTEFLGMIGWTAGGDWGAF
jgi:hypothetical protein